MALLLQGHPEFMKIGVDRCHRGRISLGSTILNRQAPSGSNPIFISGVFSETGASCVWSSRKTQLLRTLRVVASSQRTTSKRPYRGAVASKTKGRSLPTTEIPTLKKQPKRRRGLLQKLFGRPLGLVGPRASTLLLTARLALRFTAGTLLRGFSGLLEILLAFFCNPIHYATGSRSFL
jgi:hypothetical protein